MATTANIRLSIINSMLRTIGSAPLSGEDTQHPDYITANDILEEVIEELSAHPLWFNSSMETLYQTTNGKIALPNNTVACDPVDGSNLVAREGYLWDVDKRTAVIGTDVQCYLQRELELSSMPREAIKFIRASARYKFYLDEDGGAQKLQAYRQTAMLAEQALTIVNISRMDINFFSSRAARNFFTPRSAGYQHIGGSIGSRTTFSKS